MKPFKHRFARFSAVGIASTAVHAAILTTLKIGLQIGTGPANLLGFLAAFGVSMYGQQRFTFNDRLQGQRINTVGLAILFLINALAALLLGQIAKAGWVIMLPILPAVINYLLLYLFSGSAPFRS
ncbi:MAG: GtrA family protein [Cyanobium sp.]|jgi:putative flippase GtrA